MIARKSFFLTAAVTAAVILFISYCWVSETWNTVYVEESTGHESLQLIVTSFTGQVHKRRDHRLHDIYVKENAKTTIEELQRNISPKKAAIKSESPHASIPYANSHETTEAISTDIATDGTKPSSELRHLDIETPERHSLRHQPEVEEQTHLVPTSPTISISDSARPSSPYANVQLKNPDSETDVVAKEKQSHLVSTRPAISFSESARTSNPDGTTQLRPDLTTLSTDTRTDDIKPTSEMRQQDIELPERHSAFGRHLTMEAKQSNFVYRRSAILTSESVQTSSPDARGLLKSETGTLSSDIVTSNMPRSELRQQDREALKRRFALRGSHMMFTTESTKVIYPTTEDRHAHFSTPATNPMNRSIVYFRRPKVEFPKAGRLYSRYPCTMRDASSAYERHTEVDILERQMVEENLHKCLAAAELTDYFKNRNFTPTSLTNAARLLSLVRDVVPANNSAHYGNSFCWKSPFSLGVCAGAMIEGRINNIPFMFSGHLLSFNMQNFLYYYYLNRQVSSPVMCLPSIYVAGFPKCGSSFVYCLIKKLFKLDTGKNLWTQPEKEPHFWVPRGPHTHRARPPNYDDIATYLLNFIPRKESEFVSSMPIDASPNLMFQWPHYSPKETVENYCLAPSVLPVIQPQNKYIVVLRNPVSMLYSAFWFATSTFCRDLNRTQQEMAPDIFHNKVVKKIKIYRNCISHKPVDACLDIIFHPMTSSLQSLRCGRVRLEVGFYYYYIRRWLAVVPREQFLFVTIEQLNSDFSATLQQLVDFLGLKYIDITRYPSLRSNDCVNYQSFYDYHRDPALQMRNDTKQLLYEFFDPMNQKLAELLQDSKYLWKP